MVLWYAAALIAFFIKGLCGFANTLVFTSILSFFQSNVNISPVELLMGYPSNIILAVKERRSIQKKVVLPLIVLVIAGSIPGALFLKNADSALVKVVFGAVIVLIGLEMLLRGSRRGGGKQNKAALALIGLLSGILCGLYGVGALLGAYISRVTEDSHGFKGNICAVFAAENTFRIALYVLWGIITPQIFLKALAVSPAMLIGMYLGMKSSSVLNEETAKKIVIVMLIVSGLSLIATNI